MKRVATALILIPFIVWIALWAPEWAFGLVLAASGLIAFYEFERIAGLGWLPMALGMAAGLAVLFAPEPFFVALLAAFAAMTLSLASRDLPHALSGSAALVLGVLYIFGAWRCAVGLRALDPYPLSLGRHWLMIALLVSWAGDTAALYVGRAFGRRKLAPSISPGKTWEGAAASVIGGMLAAGLYAHFVIPSFPLAQVLAIAAAANIAGQIGDLCESAFKRGAGVKDSGSTLPGHGGWLDRIDSLLFAIPTVYAILRFL
jgi:phosphatidate cytidylyltransferase